MARMSFVVEDRRVEDLDAEVGRRTASEFTFLMLVPLAGG
jgi:hypothetical protein